MGYFAPLYMDKRYSQLELFSQDRGDEPGEPLPERRPFMFQVNNFERVVFSIIALIVTGSAAFCLGIERGKAIAIRSGLNRYDLVSSPAPRKQLQATVALPAVTPPQGVVREKKVPAPILAGKQQALVAPGAKGNAAPVAKVVLCSGSYTIQVGTFQQKDAAERERQFLVKKGFSPQVMMTRNGFTVICVGNFSNKETAKSLLSRLRQDYRDCYIRRL